MIVKLIYKTGAQGDMISVRPSSDKLSRSVNLHHFRSESNQRTHRALKEPLDLRTHPIILKDVNITIFAFWGGCWWWLWSWTRRWRRSRLSWTCSLSHIHWWRGIFSFLSGMVKLTQVEGQQFKSYVWSRSGTLCMNNIDQSEANINVTWSVLTNQTPEVGSNVNHRIADTLLSNNWAKGLCRIIKLSVFIRVISYRVLTLKLYFLYLTLQ